MRNAKNNSKNEYYLGKYYNFVNTLTRDILCQKRTYQDKNIAIQICEAFKFFFQVKKIVYWYKLGSVQNSHFYENIKTW